MAAAITKSTERFAATSGGCTSMQTAAVHVSLMATQGFGSDRSSQCDFLVRDAIHFNVLRRTRLDLIARILLFQLSGACSDAVEAITCLHNDAEQISWIGLGSVKNGDRNAHGLADRNGGISKYILVSSDPAGAGSKFFESFFAILDAFEMRNIINFSKFLDFRNC